MSWTDYDTDPFEGLPKVAHPDLANPNRALHFVPVARSLDTEALLARVAKPQGHRGVPWAQRVVTALVLAAALWGGLVWIQYIDRMTAINVQHNIRTLGPVGRR